MTADDIVIEPAESNFFDMEPDVYYEATVTHIVEIPNKFPDARTPLQIQFDFEIAGESNKDGTVASRRGWAAKLWVPRAKLYKWVTAIVGPTSKDLPFRTSLLLGKPCRIIDQSGFDDDGNAVVRLNVVAPAKNGKKATGTLRARLEADPPKGATVVDTLATGAEDACSAPECERMAEAYTSKGTPFCEDHMP